MVMGACLWISKGLWDELGSFPEWFESLAEDLYLCCLVRLKGLPVTVLRESGYDHWIGRSFKGGKVVRNSLRTSYRRRALSERNKTFTMAICYPSPAAIVLIPLHLLMLVAEGLVFSLLKGSIRVFSEIYWFSLQGAWKEKSRLWGLRRTVQSNRRISSRRFFSAHTWIPHKLTLLLKFGLPGIE